ncbi:hypothetical protein SNEBB_009313 [Seison nebaliae]|nr:hypothetical protein SNEBB_009313 [Seison nebaliae]
MVLGKFYSISSFSVRWDKLNELVRGSCHCVRGFYNTQALGICLTNAVLAMFIASSHLMRELNKLDKGPSSDEYYEQMEEMKNCLYKPDAKKDHVHISSSHVLVKGISDTCNDIEYRSEFGVAGDLYLVLSFYKNSKLENMTESISNDEICRIHIRKTKSYSRNDDVRWTDLLTTLFQPPELLISVDNIDLTFYSNINTLNIAYDIRNVIFPRFELAPMIPQIFRDEISEKIIQKMQKMTEDINPTVVTLNFIRPFYARVHGSFYYRFINMLTSQCRPSRRHIAIDYSKFVAVYSLQSYTVPEIPNNTPYLFELPFIPANKQYELRAINIRLMEEIEFTFDTIPDIPFEARGLKLTRDKCADKLMINIKKQMVSYRLDHLTSCLDNNLNQLEPYLLKICGHVNNGSTVQEFYTRHMPVHAISLIHRNGDWRLMNDDKSLKIENVNELSKELEEETVFSALFEEKNENILSTTTSNSHLTTEFMKMKLKKD